MPFFNFKIKTTGQTVFIDITSQVKRIVSDAGIREGICLVYIPHTTCGVTINEAADPDVQRDMLMELNRIVPFQDGYAHAEGNSAAHIKTSMMGPSVSIPVHDERLTLGTWQGIYLTEFDGPRNRSVYVQLIPPA
ncbi:secondary thiamine-phosphate synthase enzyme YjbQ [Marispirochaeta sp.]|jgi:secondary thiamine-phosphate synthase enzyme|uniref:secondary thiamine-phosphate synthase enzyme YjbQ n=1 Tax=Marispirochaeta sp. TaxID=2038653 RepID=UPI0029C6E4FE|nr:secondary thiamine-phosphate synthase enzyme YjbQ [Marispirochaeta sp.]